MEESSKQVSAEHTLSRKNTGASGTKVSETDALLTRAAVGHTRRAPRKKRAIGDLQPVATAISPISPTEPMASAVKIAPEPATKPETTSEDKAEHSIQESPKATQSQVQVIKESVTKVAEEEVKRTTHGEKLQKSQETEPIEPAASEPADVVEKQQTKGDEELKAQTAEEAKVDPTKSKVVTDDDAISDTAEEAPVAAPEKTAETATESESTAEAVTEDA